MWGRQTLGNSSVSGETSSTRDDERARREDPSVIRSRQVFGLPGRFVDRKGRNRVEENGDETTSKSYCL